MTALSDGSQDPRPDPGARGNLEAETDARAADRFVSFSDAVIAIAITLLALALPVPDTSHQTNVQILHKLGALWPNYRDFLISFAVIGGHWATHRRIFRYVRRVGGHVDRLNMIWLLMMIVMPYATKLLSSDGGALGVRFAIYAGIQIIATGCLMEMSREIRQGGMLRSDAPDSARRPDTIPFLAIMLVFLISIPVAFHTIWAFALWAASPLAARVLRLLAPHRRQAAAHPAAGARHRSGR